MATHSSVLAWRIPGTGEPGELPSMELHTVGHDLSDLADKNTQKNKLFFYKEAKGPWERLFKRNAHTSVYVLKRILSSFIPWWLGW